MSQPPYPPGQPSGPQPGWGPQPGPGQTPGGYPGQGGYPPSGGYPQQPGYGQYGQTGQVGPFGQSPQYGYPGGYGPPAPPPRKSPLPWLLAGGGVLVIAAAVVLILTLTSGSDTSTPQAVAEATVSAINDRDADRLVEISCEKYKSRVQKDLLPTDDPDVKGVKVELVDVSQDGDKATAQIKLTRNGAPSKDVTPKVNLDFVKENGDWKFCGFDVNVGRDN
jgi:hypothetical protein